MSWSDPRGPTHTYFNDGGGGLKNFSGFDILAKRGFFGVCENNTGIFGGIVFFISSNQQ